MSFVGGLVSLEHLMVGAIGFLAACVLTLMVIPAVHHRAVRLTRQRDGESPLSLQEMRAEKDTIRAGFAAATRKLELNLEQLRDKTAAHAAELAKKTQIIARLRQELDAAGTALRESETREQAVRAELRDARREHVGKSLSAAERDIAAIKAEIAAITPALLRVEKQAATRLADVVTLAPARPPLDVAPPPMRLLPPVATLPVPQNDDHVPRDWSETQDASRRVDGRHDGVPFGRRPNSAAPKS